MTTPTRPDPRRPCERVTDGRCMFNPDTCTPTCHLDWNPEDEPMDTPRAEEHLGKFTLYRRENRDAKGPFYLLSWAGSWLPGTYADRDAALLAIGIVTGGENRFYIDDLKRWCATQNPDTRHNGYITVDAIMAALNKVTGS